MKAAALKPLPSVRLLFLPGVESVTRATLATTSALNVLCAWQQPTNHNARNCRRNAIGVHLRKGAFRRIQVARFVEEVHILNAVAFLVASGA